MSRHEYRVVWKREGLRRVTAIFQTRKGAEDKADRLRGEFVVLADGGYGGVVEVEGVDWLADLGVPDLEYLHIESRPVGEWAEVAA